MPQHPGHIGPSVFVGPSRQGVPYPPPLIACRNAKAQRVRSPGASSSLALLAPSKATFLKSKVSQAAALSWISRAKPRRRAGAKRGGNRQGRFRDRECGRDSTPDREPIETVVPVQRIEALHDALASPRRLMRTFFPLFRPLCWRCSTPRPIFALAAPYERSLSVIITRGGVTPDFRSFFMSRCAARVSLRAGPGRRAQSHSTTARHSHALARVVWSGTSRLRPSNVVTDRTGSPRSASMAGQMPAAASRRSRWRGPNSELTAPDGLSSPDATPRSHRASPTPSGYRGRAATSYSRQFSTRYRAFGIL